MSSRSLKPPDKGGPKSKIAHGASKQTLQSEFFSHTTMTATGASVHTRHSASKQREEQWNQQGFTTKSFTTLHKHIYPIIEKIISQEDHRDHPFTKEWNAMKQPPKLMDYLQLQRDMQWSSARILFKDLHGYKTYINTCPDIHKYLKLKTNERNKSWPTIHNNIQTVKQLPTLHTDKMIQHAKVPYSGREQAFYWYLSVKNSLHEYGILLIPLEEFLPGRCLCPQSYYGTTVEVEHYLIMTNALYLFLAKNDTHNDHTDITTRISKYAAEANGYTVLYEIMQLVHPLLNPYAKIERPTTTDSVDIHNYYSKLNTYFLYIKLKEKREFDPRTKAQYFIEGMDATYPTVK
jgi:hypothetical protein